MRLDYYVPTRDESTERVVDPLRVVTADGHTYLDAWCHLAEDQRLFRLDRISTRRGARHARRAAHRPGARATSPTASSSPSTDDLLVTPATSSPTPAGWRSTTRSRTTARAARRRPDRSTLRVGDPRWLTRLVLRLGASAELVDPPELAGRVRRVAPQALRNYA